MLSALVALTRSLSSVSPSCFPQTVPYLGVPLPSTGSSRAEFSCFHGTIRTLRLPAIPPAALRFPSFGGTTVARSLCSLRCGVRHRGPGDAASRAGYPLPASPVEMTGPLTFLGNLTCALALLFDPGRTHASGRYNASARPPLRPRRRLPHGYFRGSITRLRHSLSTLRRMGYPTSTQDLLPAAGQALPGGIDTRKVPTKGFSLFDYFASSFPKLRDARTFWFFKKV